MSTTRRRGAVFAVAIVAVTVGGALFPAAGLGSVPGGESAGSVPSDGNGAVPDDGSTAGEPGTSLDPEPTTETEPSVPADASATASRPSSGAANATATATGTTAPTTTESTGETPVSDQSDDRAFLVVPLVAGVVALVFALLVVSEWETRPSQRPGAGDGGDDGGDGGGAGGLPSVTRLPQMTMVTLLGFSTAMANVLRTTGAAAGTLADGLGLVVRSGVTGTGRVFGDLGAVLALLSVPRPGPSVAGAWGLLSGLGGGRSSTGDATPTPFSSDPTTPLGDDDDDAELTSVEDAWDRFTDAVSVSRPSATTPGEYARRAVDAGAPEEPVRRLTRLFRRVRYGGVAPTDEQTAAAIAACRAITAEEDDE